MLILLKQLTNINKQHNAYAVLLLLLSVIYSSLLFYPLLGKRLVYQWLTNGIPTVCK